MLPDDFRWDIHHTVPNTRWLFCGTVAVASVCDTVDGRWLMHVNRQRWLSKGRGYSASRDHAMRLVERWATVNADRLRRECADPRLRDPPTGAPKLSRAEVRAEQKIRG